MGLPGSGYIAAHGVGRKIKNITISAAAQQYGMSKMSFQLACDQVARNNTTGLPIDDHHIQHLMPGIHLDIAERHLALQCLISPYQQLLPCLARRVKSTLYLGPTERPVAEQAPVFTSKRHPLRHTLVDNVGAHLRQTMDIGFTRAVVASLYRIVEQTKYAVPVILIIFGGIDPSLGRNAVRPARRVLETKCLYFISQLT